VFSRWDRRAMPQRRLWLVQDDSPLALMAQPGRVP
jgi:hypothetical protein